MAGDATDPLNLASFRSDRLNIVIGIDVGTTCSAVSYAFLKPDQIPEVQTVTRFSGQTIGDSKIPSVVYYDTNGKVMSIGAATLKDTVIDDAETYGWIKVEYFKLYLRPHDKQQSSPHLMVGQPPASLTATQIMADYLRYLHNEVKTYIEDSHADGKELWEQVKDRAAFVLSHPNGWTGLSQQRMRQSAITAGLIPNTSEGHGRLDFVTEGEASALACLFGGLGPVVLKSGFRFVILDAGGGTLDINSYEITNTAPMELQEITVPDCRFAGSVCVNARAKEMLQKKLQGTKFDDSGVLQDIIDKSFELKTKRIFDDDAATGLIRIGDRRDNDQTLEVRGGFLRVSGKELADCFEFSINEAIMSVKAQLELCGEKDMPIWLVGGFSASPWLFQRLQKALKELGSTVRRPDMNTSKAVANGAVLYYLTRAVSGRVSRSSFGVLCSHPFDPNDVEHQARHRLVKPWPSGRGYIGPIFDPIVWKGSIVKESQRFIREYYYEAPSPNHATFVVQLYRYDGPLPIPKWYGENQDKFRTMCSIQADLSELCSNLRVSRIDPSSLLSQQHCLLTFCIELKFGATELGARIIWEADVGPLLPNKWTENTYILNRALKDMDQSTSYMKNK